MKMIYVPLAPALSIFCRRCFQRLVRLMVSVQQSKEDITVAVGKGGCRLRFPRFAGYFLRIKIFR